MNDDNDYNNSMGAAAEDDERSMKEDEVEESMLEEGDGGGGDDDNDKFNNSSTSLDKYVGKGRNSKYMTLLPEDFEPGDMDVLCGRGKRCFNSPGNQRFRKLVAARAEDYSAASTRTDKTFIVCSIVSEVRKASPKGGFVKKDSTTGRWYEVGDFNAHEKTSQMFRDVLHESYLSSNKSKKKRRDLFRTNSKKRMQMQQQATINASAGRFLRGNVARHHSYGSVKRAVGAQPYSLMKMRASQTHSNRSESWRNSAHSAHSGHESWQNSWHEGDGINSEPGLLLSKNPRFSLAGRRQNSLGDMNNSIGELQAQDQFHNSFGEFNTGGDFNNNNMGPTSGANFHNSCVEFPSSFADGNNNSNHNRNNVPPQQFHNSFGGFDAINNAEFNINSNDFHNSFGEIPYNNNNNNINNRLSPVPMMARSGRQAYRDDYNYSPNPDRQPQYTLDADSVPLSINVPGSEGGARGHTSSDFQLEFETDENSGRNSGSQNRTRGRFPNYNQHGNNNMNMHSNMNANMNANMNVSSNMNVNPNMHVHPGMNMNPNMNMNMNMNPTSRPNNAPSADLNNLSIVDTLETVGYSNNTNDNMGGGDDPFEPVPLPDMEPESIF